MSVNIELTYWNGKGNHQAFVDKVQALVPASGEVPNAKKNPALEKFRKAMNVYYDVYNNGLCNRAAQFKGAFGFASGQYKLPYEYGSFGQNLYNRMEAAMDDIINAAAIEQGIVRA